MEQQIIKCVFCKGKGENPFYWGTCPVCKGRGKNEVTTPYIVCSECRGSGKKSGTTLTCFNCRGIGVVPDMREVIKKARKEISDIQKEMTEEKNELYGKISKKVYPESLDSVYSERSRTARDRRVEVKMQGKKKRPQSKEKLDEFDDFFATREDSKGKYFCQSCAKEGPRSSAYKVCEECFFLYKFGKVRKIKPKEKELEEENEG